MVREPVRSAVHSIQRWTSWSLRARWTDHRGDFTQPCEGVAARLCCCPAELVCVSLLFFFCGGFAAVVLCSRICSAFIAYDPSPCALAPSSMLTSGDPSMMGPEAPQCFV